MAVKIDAGAVAAKRISSIPSSIHAKKSAKQSTLTASSPTSNGSVTARRSDLNGQAKLLKLNLNTAYQKQSPQVRANEIVERNGGRGDLNTDAVGKELAEIAVRNPAEAKAVSVLVLDQIKDKDKDEVAQSFTDNLNDSELATVAKDPDGKALLEKYKDHLLSGSVHGDERASAAKLQNAIQGFPTPQLTGNAVKDIQMIADDLADLSPEKRAEYLNVVVQDTYGMAALQRSANLSIDDRQVLADGLGNAYNADPVGFGSQIMAFVETEKMFPVAEWTGFARIISMTGNDALIAKYADAAIDYAAKNPDENNAQAVDAIQALAGMSSAALSNFISFRSIAPPQSGSPTAIGQAAATNEAQFQNILKEATSWLGGDANNVGFANPWSFTPALGDFLNTASKLTNQDGTPTTMAMNIFQTVATNTGDNFYTKEAAGAFFVDHAQAIVDRFGAITKADGRPNPNFEADVLKDFFAGVVYSPISDLLEYNGKPLTEVIMGDGAANSGVIGDVAGTIMDRAANGGDPAASGRQIGYLFGAVSGGFLDSVEAYKDKFNDDKEFREFAYGLVNKGLGAIGKKAGIPLDKIASFGEKLYEAGKARERSEKLQGFGNAFLDLKDDMTHALLSFEYSNEEAKGLEAGFTLAWTESIAIYLAKDWITD